MLSSRFVGRSLVMSSLCSLAASATAEPTVRLSWGSRCDDIVSVQDCEGPSPYRLLAIGEGLEDPLGSVTIRVRISPPSGITYPDAWRFESAECHRRPDLIPVLPAGGAGCVQLAQDSYWTWSMLFYEPWLPEETHELQYTYVTHYRPLDPEPWMRVALAEIDFNHHKSVAGEGDPPLTCGGGDVPMRFALHSLEWRVGGQIHVVSGGPGGEVFWQAMNPANCFTPVRAESWGRIKQQYR